MNERGILLVLSGCSGVGKGTVVSSLRRQREHLHYSVSVTTRAPRPGERDGVNYYYRTQEEFDRLVGEDAFLEYARYVNHSYGTPAAPVDEHLEAGDDVLVEIEVQGAMQIKEKRPDAVLVFLVPPSVEELEHRLRGRGTENEEVIRGRLEAAREELRHAGEYRYRVVNDRVDLAVERLSAILLAEKCRAPFEETSFFSED